MPVRSDRLVPLAAAAGCLAGLAVGWLWASPDPLEHRVLEALVLAPGDAAVDGRRLRWLAYTADGALAAWAREELRHTPEAPPAAPRAPAPPARYPVPPPAVPAPIPAPPTAPPVADWQPALPAPVPVAAPRPVDPSPPPVQTAGFRMPSPAPVAVREAPAAPRPRPAPEPRPTPRRPDPVTEPQAAPAPAAEEPPPTPEPAPEPAPEPPPPPPPPAPRGVVTAGSPTLYGALEPDDVNEALATRFRRWNVCYDDALARNRDAAGTIELAFAVTSGHVSGLEVGLDEIGDRKLTRCVSQVARMLHFDGDGEVVLPLELKLQSPEG